MTEKKYTLEEAARYIAGDLAEKKLIDLRADREARLRLDLDSWEEPNYEAINMMPVTRPAWLIGDFIEKGTVGLLNGIYGSAKSFLALDWACSVATGLTWAGHQVERGKVVYVAAEGSQGIGRRYAAWSQSNDHEVNPTNMDVILAPVQLGYEVAVDWLCKHITTFGADFLIIDTLARSIDGLNENDSVDMAKVITALYRLRDARGENGTTVLVVHHTGWADQSRSRGSTRLPSDTDFSYTTTKGDMTKPFMLKCNKLKEDRQPDPFSFNLETVQVAEGVESCVVRQTSVWTPPEEDYHAQETATQKAILAALKVNDGQSTADLASSTGVARSVMSQGLTGLKDADRVRCEQVDGRNWVWYLSGNERSQLDKLARPHLRAVRKKENSTNRYLWALANLEEETGGPVSVTQIAEQLGVTHRAADEKLKAMEAKQLIKGRDTYPKVYENLPLVDP